MEWTNNTIIFDRSLPQGTAQVGTGIVDGKKVAVRLSDRDFPALNLNHYHRVIGQRGFIQNGVKGRVGTFETHGTTKG